MTNLKTTDQIISHLLSIGSTGVTFTETDEITSTMDDGTTVRCYKSSRNGWIIERN